MNTLSIEDRLIKISLQLREILPFYYSVYAVIDKIQTEEIDIAGVDHKSFYYNPKNLNKLPDDELLFVVLHEICHIALKHASRIGDKDPKLFNIAADLYVNRLIESEIYLKNSHKNVSYPDWVLKDYRIINRHVDLYEDSVESIYKELLDNNYKSNNYEDDFINALCNDTYRYDSWKRK